MLTEFALLATLTLNADEREALRGEISDWVTEKRVDQNGEMQAHCFC